jgi:hypothetical protein
VSRGSLEEPTYIHPLPYIHTYCLIRSDKPETGDDSAHLVDERRRSSISRIQRPVFRIISACGKSSIAWQVILIIIQAIFKPRPLGQHFTKLGKCRLLSALTLLVSAPSRCIFNSLANPSIYSYNPINPSFRTHHCPLHFIHLSYSVLWF